jgi:N-carbamoyl-L-amino-acid hydrolase
MFSDVSQLKGAIDLRRIKHWIEEFSEIGKDPIRGMTRPGLSEEETVAKTKAISLMKEIGLHVSVDPFGNIIGRRDGSDPRALPIMTGSHLDTVQNGGRFDGTVGVVAALEVIHALDTLKVITRHPIEVIVFTSEEPNRFGISAFGSKGLSGKWNFGELSKLRDEKGTPFPAALRSVGIDWESLPKTHQPSRLHAFIELHVEQGQRLYQKGIPIGVVLGVTGIYRQQVTVRGQSNHSGTTSMPLRKDALTTASEIILVAEKCARTEGDEDATATVGRIQVRPNQVNIVPDEVLLTVEFRSFLPEMLSKMKNRFTENLSEIREKRKTEILAEEILNQPPLRFSEKVIRSVQRGTDALGFPSMNLFSMAGHDANHLASITDAGMIFVPSKEGFSHCPREWTDAEDVAKGCMVLLHSILYLDGESQ